MDFTALIRHGGLSALRDWKRSVWLIAGVTLGIALYIALSGIGASYTALVKLPFSRIESDLIIQLGTRGSSRMSGGHNPVRLPFSNQAIAKDTILAIGALPGIKKINGAILLWYQDHRKFLTIAGIDPADTAHGPAKVLQWIGEGRTLQAPGETVVESHHARFNKLKIGDVVHFNNRGFTIVGKTDIKEGASLASANFYIAANDARELARMADGAANLLSATLHKGMAKDPVKDKITQLLPGALVSSSDSIGEMMQGFARISTTSSLLLSGVALAFTVLLSGWLVTGRQQEQAWKIGLMQTLGWEKRDILISIGAETLVLSVSGAIAGLLVGLIIIFGMGFLEVSLTLPWNLAAVPEGMHNAATGTMQVPLPIIVQPLHFFGAMSVTCLATTMAGIWTAARLTAKGIRHTLFEH